jgi:hypothetical protein
MLSADEFIIRFPEFETAGPAMVQGALDLAAAGMSVCVYGERFNEAQGYLAAHKLAVSPYGKDARLSDDKGMSTYFGEFRRIRAEVSPRMMVT